MFQSSPSYGRVHGNLDGKTTSVILWINLGLSPIGVVHDIHMMQQCFEMGNQQHRHDHLAHYY